MKKKYVDKKFAPSNLAIIENANKIIAEYQAQGMRLTIRQIYYQFVSRGLVDENTDKKYKHLASVINDGRLAGMVDWTAIEDITRYLRRNAHWETPAEMIESCADQFAVDQWEGQEYRPEVWIEKDALVGVIDRVCRENDVPYFSCRGYTAQTSMWEAAQRLIGYARRGQAPVIIHLGDHDPSGVDMTRDVEDRMRLFMGQYGKGFEVRRIALNMNQVRKYNPPPNPAKLTDCRARGYIAEHGDESWELDALEPRVLTKLIQGEIDKLKDEDAWQERLELRAKGREKLAEIAAEHR